MNKGGMGVGSSSIMLIFAVLCLTIFSLISLSVAQNDKSLVDAETRLVVGYYEADELAERILAEILKSGSIPGEIYGVSIETYWDWDIEAEVASFACPISDAKQLNVKIAIYDDNYDILTWKMWDGNEWENILDIEVWPGFEDMFLW